MNVKTVTATVGIVAALVLGVVNLGGGVPVVEVNVPPANPTPVQVVNNVPEQAAPQIVVKPSEVKINNIPAEETKSFGAVSGPDLYSPYWNVNGVTTYYYRADMRKATTTLCAFLLPNATSTVRYASWKVNTGTSTAATIDLATSTTAYSTTTNLVAATSIASGAKGYASFIPNQATTDGATGPATYLVVKTAGAGLGGYTYTGTCEAIVTSI